MKPRFFNSIMPRVNHQWAAKVLDMRVNPHKGPDLIDENKFVEIKFRLFPNSKNYVKWTILEYQMNYPINGKTPYWGLGTYQLKKPVSEIKTKNELELENLVISRQLYIVEWDWMNQFESYHNQGQTKISSWNHSLRNAKLKKLPEIIQTYNVEKGIVYLTEGVLEKDFQIKIKEMSF
jgi:hypothetical protein